MPATVVHYAPLKIFGLCGRLWEVLVLSVSSGLVSAY